jgi:C-terminal domain on Strawberry notch homologue/P-loop containing NTP hydrolase pore-1/ddrB-like ParB superfamily domain
MATDTIDLSAGLEPVQAQDSAPDNIDLSAGMEAKQDQAAPSPNPNIDMSQVAGATPGMSSPAQVAAQGKGGALPQPGTTMQAAPAPGMFSRARTAVANSPIGRTLESSAPGVANALGVSPTESESARQEDEANAGDWLEYHPIDSAKQIGQGVKNLAESGAIGAAPSAPGTIEPPIPQNPNVSQAAKGATQAMSGSMGVTKPLVPLAIASAPLRSAIMYGAGIMAGNAAEDVSAKMGATPEEQEFFKTALFFLPDTLLKVSGLKSWTETQGNTERASASMFGGRVQGTVARNPQAVGVAGKVGPFDFGFAKPRDNGVNFSDQTPGGLPKPEPTPAEAISQKQGAQVDDAAKRASAVNDAAHAIATGQPPPPPPPAPPVPAGMEDGLLSQPTVDHAIKAVTELPPEARPGAVQEVVSKLADWFGKVKTAIMPNGKVQVIDSPKAAVKTAVDTVNNAMDAHDAKNDAADQEGIKDGIEETPKENAPQEAATQPKKPIPETAAVKLARKKLATLPEDASPEDMHAALGNLAITSQTRNDLVNEAVASRPEPKPKAEQPALTETGPKPEELQSQADSVKAGDSPFMRVPHDNQFRPKNVDDLSRTAVTGAKNKDFNGIYYHSPDITGDLIRKAARDKNDPQGALDKLEADWKANKGNTQEPVKSDIASGEPNNETPKVTSEEQPKQEESPALEGKKVFLNLSDGSRIPARHKLAELSDIIPSHRPTANFAPREDYPQQIQERRYESSKDEQMKVQGQANDLKPELMSNTDTTGISGPPLVTSRDATYNGRLVKKGTVIGGNSRAMTADLVYNSITNGDSEKYKTHIDTHHRDFGFAHEPTTGFHQPVHVLEIEPPSSIEELERLASVVNKPLTQELDVFDRAVSLAKQLSPETLQGISDLVRDASTVDHAATFNSILTSQTSGRAVVRMLEGDGVITDRNRPAWVDPATGTLNPDARPRLANAMLATLLDSRELMEQTPAILKQRLLGSLGSISSIIARDDDWNLAPAMRAAATEFGRLTRSSHASVTEGLKQSGMFEQRGPVVTALTKAFDSPVGDMRKAFGLFAADAAMDVQGQATLGLLQKPEPWDAFNVAFGTELTKEQFDSEIASITSLSNQGIKATMDAMRQQNPASNRTEEQQRQDAERDIAAQKEQARLLLEHLQEGNPNVGTEPGLVEGLGAEDRGGAGEPKDALAGNGAGDAAVRGETGSGDGGQGNADTQAQSSVRAGEPLAGEVRPFVKGEKVKYTTNKGKIRDGEVMWTDGKKVRIKDGKYDFTKDIKDVQHLGGAPAAEEPGQPEVKQTLISTLRDAIQGGGGPADYNGLKRLVQEFDGKEPDQLRMKAAQEAYEAAMMDHSSRIVAQLGAKPAFDKLVRLYEGQPNLAIRTSTSVTNQAYSTPSPLAFVAGKLAGIVAGGDTYEPTGGNGMLLIAQGPFREQRSNALVNEIDQMRRENLKELGFNVSDHDATTWAPSETFDSVAANPPFGSLPAPIEFDGYSLVKLEHLIAAKALGVMKDAGKATIILGASKEPGDLPANQRPFFNWLYSHYNVVADFELAGEMYSRQGASWPVRVIAVDGRVRSAKVAPAQSTIQRLTTWEQVYEQASNVLGADLKGQRQADVEPSGAVQGAGARPSDLQGSPSGLPQPANTGRPQAGAAGSGGSVGSGQPGPIVHSDGVPTEGVGSPDNVVASDGDVAQSDRLAEDQPRPKAVRRGSPESGRPSPDAIAQEGNQFQDPYSPYSEKKDVNVLAPKAMNGAMWRAMENLSDQVGDLDQFVADELGYGSVEHMQEAFMGLQVDTIAAAIHAISKGKAIIIADQTGIGKGRQAAAIIRWANLHGHLPIFVTAKAQLFSDMYGDLIDIGSENTFTPLLMNADATITHPETEEKLFKNPDAMTPVFQRILETGRMPEGNNALFTTYSQVNKANRQQQVLARLAPNAVFILDEAHKAGGESNTGLFFRNILNTSRGATFLSATYAKRPDNMPLYADMTDIGIAIPDREKIVSAIDAGGAPLQAVVSYQLAQSGQLFRRERSFDGISFHTHIAEGRQKQHERISDDVTNVLRAIVEADAAFHENDFQNIKDDVEGEGGSAEMGGNRASQTVQHMEFTSVVHNATKQLLLGLKADDVAQQIIKDIRDGKKPIVALENTMGSFLDHYVEQNGLTQGAPLHNFTYGTVLQRSLDRTRYYNHTDDKGRKKRVEVPLEQLSEGTRALYDEAQALIRSLNVDVPVSPIDWIRAKVEAAGHSIAEITGRTLRVDYSRDVPVLSKVPTQEKKDRVATARGYNNGGIDSLIMNLAGSTGISLHPSVKAKDQRTRIMYVVQPAGDVNEFMQMLGRINRTGQVRLPEYVLYAVALPAETRPAMMLSRKLKSLNANTTSNTRSAVGVDAPDMMNKYGDRVVQGYLAENPEMARALGMSIADDAQDDDDHTDADIARKATGRSALLPVIQQKEFMGAVTEAYTDLIKYLDDTGQNDLEPKTYDFDAKLKGGLRTVYQGTDPRSPFGQDAHFGEYSIKKQGKPYTPDEVKQHVDDTISEAGAKDAIDFHRKLYAQLDEQYNAFLARQESSGARDWAMQTKDGSRNAMNMNRVGSGIRLEINGETYNAVVTNIEGPKKPAGNPYAQSGIKYTLDVAGPMRSIKVSGTELRKIGIMSLGDRADIKRLFREVNPDARVTARIITGNLLGAYGALTKNVKGRIISFTMNDGSKQIGIVMPQKFDPAQHVQDDYAMRTADGVHQIVQEYKGQGAAVSAPGGDVILMKDSGGMLIKTKASRAAGGKFFLDPDLRAVINTGDFVTRGGMMVANVTRGQETRAIKIIMAKTALYPTVSMQSRAREIERVPEPPATPPPPPTQKPTGGGNTVGFGMLGTQYADQAVQAAGAYGKAAAVATFDDLVKAAGIAKRTAKAAGYEIAAALYPGILADSDARDAMGRALGKPALEQFKAGLLLEGVSKMFDGMSEEDQVEFVDRYQHGEDQPSPDLQNAAELIRGVLENQRRQENEAINLGRSKKDRIQLSDKANYFPNRYEVPPGKEELIPEEEHIASIAPKLGKRPFAGPKTFLKQQRYTLKEAVGEGAKPLGNPVVMVLRRVQEGAKFVAAHEYMHNLKEVGQVIFVRGRKPTPEGYVDIQDNIAKVWRPVETAPDAEGISKTVFVESGRWVGDENALRLLNNYLSKDHIRASAIGKTFCDIKNASTSFKLGLSPFHYGVIGFWSMATRLAQGMDEFYNQGLRDFDPTRMSAGVKKAATFIYAPVAGVREGGMMLDYLRNPDGFLGTPLGQKFAEAYPDFPHLLDLVYAGGIRMGMTNEYRVSMGEGFWHEIAVGHLGKATLKAFPWLAQMVTKPLFEHIIPRTKLVFAVQMLSQKLEQYSDAISTGQVTEAKLARDVVAAIENRFGEFNYDNLYWNNTMRTAMQLTFRAASWKLGTWRGAAQAARETFSSQAFEDHIYDRIDEEGTKGDWARKYTRRLPQVGLNTSGLVAAGMLMAITGTVIAKMASNKWPWEWAQEDHRKLGMNVGAAMAFEAAHPRTGVVNPKTGIPMRFSFPTDLRDYEHALVNPKGYVRGSLSDPTVNMLDTLQNRDAFNNYVFNPADPLWKEFQQGVFYNLQGDFTPISVNNYRDQYGPQDGATRVEKMAGVVGGSPQAWDRSAAMNRARELHDARDPHTPLTPEEQTEHELSGQSKPTRRQVLEAARDRNLDALDKYVKYQLTYTEAKEIFDRYANSNERETLRPILERKRMAAILAGRKRGNGTVVVVPPI